MMTESQPYAGLSESDRGMSYTPPGSSEASRELLGELSLHVVTAELNVLGGK